MSLQDIGPSALDWRNYPGPTPRKEDYPSVYRYHRAVRERQMRFHEAVAMRKGFIYGSVSVGALVSALCVISHLIL